MTDCLCHRLLGVLQRVLILVYHLLPRLLPWRFVMWLANQLICSSSIMLLVHCYKDVVSTVHR